MKTKLPTNYKPTSDEPFMNSKQREYFRRRLQNWREDLLQESSATLQYLQEESVNAPDIADRASMEAERSVELRTRERSRRLSSKSDRALPRIGGGSYGFCVETEEPSGIGRLGARPIATLSLEAQERHERLERTYRDD